MLGTRNGWPGERWLDVREATTQTGSYGYDQYVAARKPVFQVEYRLATTRFCAADNAADLNGVRFNLKLNDSVFQPCR